MSKRIIVFISALALLLGLFVIPASADTADDDVPYIELTDYLVSPIDGTQPGAFYVSGSYTYTGNFSLPLGEISAYGYEITYSYGGDRPAVTGVSFAHIHDLNYTSRYIDGTNIGKVRGDFNGSTGSDIGISFSSSGCYITIHSFKVFLVNNYQVPLSASLPDSSYFPGDDTSDMGVFSTINIDNWRNYDFINLSFTVWTDAITSVSVILADNTSNLEITVPFDISYINLDNYQGATKPVAVTLSCDLRGIDPATTPDSSLLIHITCNYADSWMQMTSIYGSVFIPTPDKYTIWLKGQLLSLEQLSFYALSIDSNTTNIRNLFDQYYSAFNSFRTDLETSLDEKFDSLNNTFTSVVSGLQTELDLQFDLLKDYLSALEKAKWDQFYKPSFDTIFEKFDALINGNPVDPEVQQGMQDSANSLGSLGEQMQQGTPQLDAGSVNVSLGSIPSDGSQDLAYTFFDLFWNQPILLSMITTVVAVATVGFVFFGKKE